MSTDIEKLINASSSHDILKITVESEALIAMPTNPTGTDAAITRRATKSAPRSATPILLF